MHLFSLSQGSLVSLSILVNNKLSVTYLTLEKVAVRHIIKRLRLGRGNLVSLALGKYGCCSSPELTSPARPDSLTAPEIAASLCRERYVWCKNFKLTESI